MPPKVIIFDFEVFKYDVLLGAIVIDKALKKTVQLWDINDIKKFYYEHGKDIWVGHNNAKYDNYILESIIDDKDPYSVSIAIIQNSKFKRLHLQLCYHDLIVEHLGSLKAVECAFGKNISESEISFDLDRKLTADEKKLTESYNRDDLNQTLLDFASTQDELQLRLDIINEFNLPMSCLSMTGTQLAETVLHAKRIPGIEEARLEPKMYPQLKIKNKEVIDFYLSEKFKVGEKLVIDFCGVEHKLGSGGLHGAKKNKHCDWAYYFDVSGYYNLVMILFDLLPRSIPDDYKQLYKDMYIQQLALKKTNPKKRWVYKAILLSVFGAMTNQYCAFYDPYKGQLVTMVGQIFIIDLLEKLEGKIDLIQTNTDGLIAKPLPEVSDDEIFGIIDEWKTRTGFNLKLEKITDIHQRDVNCYMYRNPDGKITCLGEAIKYYEQWENALSKNVFRAKEAVIIHYAIVEYFMQNKLPEQVINEHLRQLRMFQYTCKKMSFDWLEYEETNLETGEVKMTVLQNVNRAFALKSNERRGVIYKHKKIGKVTKALLQNLPPSIFVYNNSILEDDIVDKLIPQIDYDYYIKRAYERIAEFIRFPQIKEIVI